MKRKSAWLSFTACALTAASAPHSARAVQQTAAPEPALCDMQAVSCTGGHTGFFEAKTGTLYIYDTAQGRCVGIRKLIRLGEAMENIPQSLDS